jgi:drug/metabolite transporter (DMT)-like permease
VAVAFGYFFGNESVGPRTFVGTLLVLLSVITITTTPKKHSDPEKQVELAVAEVD